jgi:alkylated DNA repair protein (DNA oxidative demethylase)
MRGHVCGGCSGPPGFVLNQDVFSVSDEGSYLRFLRNLPFEVLAMRGQYLRRNVVSFGAKFSANFQSIVAAPELPVELQDLLADGARATGIEKDGFAQAIVQRYPVGATIGWHRDAGVFGPRIIGVSFGGVASLRFKSDSGIRLKVEIPPRSVYVIAGESRTLWSHAVAGISEERYSVTFRTIQALLSPASQA